MSLVISLWQLSMLSLKSEEVVDHCDIDWRILQDIKEVLSLLSTH